MIEAQLLHARSLIWTLHPQPSTTALIEITGLAYKKKPVKRYFTDGSLAAEFAIETTNQRFNVFVGTNPRSAFSGFEQDVPYVTALPLDLQPERTEIAKVEQMLAYGGISPTIVVVSGYGAHMYLKVEPADRLKAKVVAERLIRYTGSDRIQNSNRIMRCAGSLNWKKIPPRWCYLTGVYPDRLYTIEKVDAALDRLGAGPARQPREGIPVPIEAPIDWFELRKKLSQGVLDIIDTGERNAYSEKQISRSEADWVVVCALIHAGVSDEMIHWVYESNPVGLLKYHEAGPRYLNRTIESARRATAAPIVDRPAHVSGSPRFTGGAADVYRQRSANRNR